MINRFLDSTGMPMPMYTNPAEFLLGLVSSDFSLGDDGVQSRIERMHSSWQASVEATSLSTSLNSNADQIENDATLYLRDDKGPLLRVVIALLHRSFIKSYRDVVAYGIRFAM